MLLLNNKKRLKVKENKGEHKPMALEIGSNKGIKKVRESTEVDSGK